jgi:hypothetical protein
MAILKYIPLLAVILILYNLMAFVGTSAEAVMSSQWFTLPLISGSSWAMTNSDLMITLGLIALYIELIKATKTTLASVVDHTLSVVVFIIFIVEFITVKRAGNSTFFVLTLMSLLDVIAGFTITISTARRDFTVDR